jgi:flagellar hook-basal body complex protein FliE
MIRIDPKLSSLSPNIDKLQDQQHNVAGQNPEFSNTIKAVGKYISKVDELQQSSDMSIQELLTGQRHDINTVVSTMAKADMSFKLLVGVRNKLIEAYKQTMNMSV